MNRKLIEHGALDHEFIEPATATGSSELSAHLAELDAGAVARARPG